MRGSFGDALLGRNRWSIRRTLLLWLLLSLVPLRIITAYFSHEHTRISTVSAFDLGIEDTIRGIGELVQERDGKLYLDLNREVVKVLETTTLDAIYFQVIDSKGRYLGGNAHLPIADLAINATQFVDTEFRGEGVRLGSYRQQVITSAGRDSVLIQVAQTLRGREHTLYVSIVDLVADLIITVSILVIAISWCVNLSLKNLSVIERALDTKAQNDFSPLPVETVPSEIQPLITSFNALLKRLELDILIQRRFLENAAHELKTPLAGIRTLGDLMMREKDGHNKDTLVKKILSSIDRTSNLSKKLLSLSHAATVVSQRDKFEKCDLRSICKEVIIAYQQEADQKKIDLGYSGPPNPALIYGDSGALYELIANLVENALKYTQVGGQVSVVLQNEIRPTVMVIDNGPGIPEGEREKVFERFYRVLGTNAEGSGLGLSIVKEIAEAHDASVNVKKSGSSGEEGTLIELAFPSVSAWEAMNSPESRKLA